MKVCAVLATAVVNGIQIRARHRQNPAAQLASAATSVEFNEIACMPRPYLIGGLYARYSQPLYLVSRRHWWQNGEAGTLAVLRAGAAGCNGRSLEMYQEGTWGSAAHSSQERLVPEIKCWSWDGGGQERRWMDVSVDRQGEVKGANCVLYY